MEISAHVTSPAKEESGIWINFDPDTKFLIGSTNSKKFRDLLSKRISERKRHARTRDLTPAEGETLQRSVYSEAVILGWEGVKKDGTDFPYTPENALFILNNCPTVRDWITAEAQNNDNYRIQAEEGAKEVLGEL